MNNNSDQPGFLVTGIGASAGGIQALQEFFAHVPADSGIAYVVILHLSPDHDSQLAQVLQVTAKIPVTQVTERIAVKPDHVYVIPPNQHLTIKNGFVEVSPNMQEADRRAPVDIFFRTLATSHGAQAVCVVLSGTGANGSMGLKQVKAYGGAAFVQNPREAEYNEMPRNAIATELVDEVLPVAEIPARIMAYQKNAGTIHIPAEAEKRPEEQQQALREIFTQLRIRTSHDFSNYKRPTLLRRIERRINIRHQPDLPAYVAFVQQHPEEINALLKDLLISVTNFFRDKKAFETISRDVLPTIMQGKTAENQVRIWVAGCATGEEAYSIAMLLAEQIQNTIDAPKIQVFATDIDEAAISIAREGYYTINDAADVSPEHLRRFFNKEGEGYRIRREIREMVLFANHNFIKDPPFSHLDMITCRNVLIYLNRTAQERVMETFHFALNQGGYLFLGSSESADGSNDLYTPYNREHHIFKSRKKLVRSFPVPESIPDFRVEQPRHSAHYSERGNTVLERMTPAGLHQRLLEEYAPPSVVINEEYDIVHLSEKAGRYLQVAGGEPSQNLLKLVRSELRLELRSALYQAVQKQTAIELRGQQIVIDEKTETINIHIRPLLRAEDPVKGFILVLFEPAANEAPGQEIVLKPDEPVARHLEEELGRLKLQLRVSVEQHELHAEELKASNEELQAMNEELRSAAEELETSKEELQSINEELRTVNQELKIKVEETSLNSNNLQNLINSASIGTIFLDRSFRIALFTPAAREIFNLIPGDYGRPLSDITHRLEYKTLAQDAETVLDKLVVVEREVSTTDDRSFLVRLLPYRTAEDHINGVVITFFDITKRKEAENELLTLKNELYADLSAMIRLQELSTKITAVTELPVLLEDILDATIEFQGADKGTIQLYHKETNELLVVAQRGFGRTFTDYLNQAKDDALSCRRALKTQERVIIEDVETDTGYAPHRPMAATGGYRSVQSTPLLDRSGMPIGVLSTYFRKPYRLTSRELRLTDLHAQQAAEMIALKLSEKALSESEERNRVALASADMGAWDWHLVEDTLIWNEQHFTLLGLTPDKHPKPSAFLFRFIHPEDAPAVTNALKTAVEETGIYQAEFRIVRADNGEICWMSGYGRVVEKEKGKALRMIGVMYDITGHKILQKQKDEFLSIASHELKTPVTGIKAYAELLLSMFKEVGNQEHMGLMQKLDNQVDRLTNLIRALLDVTYIAEGQLPLHPESFDLNALIASSVEDLQTLSVKHTLVFKPSVLKPVTADRERIGQVLTNLISNAVKYSPEGGEVIITSLEQEGDVQVSIQDTGIGIPEDLQQKVFDRFFRISYAQVNTFPGMGLGLYISAGIVQRHGGKIAVESKPGKGSRFYFTLPYNAII
jgi:two-component system CheB/CheR fusion protein